MMTQMPVIGVGAVVWKDGLFLLVQRGAPPCQGSWSLPGGKQQWGETVYEAVLREVREETGVEICILGLADVVDLMDRDEAGALRYHYTVVDVVAEWVSGEAVAGDDAAAVAWARPEEADRYGLTREVRHVVGLAAEKRRGAADRCGV